MGVLSDFIVATETESTAVLKSVNPTSNWRGASFKGLSEVNLAQLWAILKNADFQPTDLNQFKILSLDDSNGPWLIVIPTELTKAISEISEDELPKVILRWSATEELVLDKWSQQEVFNLVTELIQLSRVAISSQKELMLWVSL